MCVLNHFGVLSVSIQPFVNRHHLALDEISAAPQVWLNLLTGFIDLVEVIESVS